MNKQRASKAKGKRGEKAVAEILAEAGFEARTGRHPEPDVVSNFPYRIEVKNQERLGIQSAIEQALNDGGRIVVFKQKRGTWYAAIPFPELIDFILNDKRRSDSRVGEQLLGSGNGIQG